MPDTIDIGALVDDAAKRYGVDRNLAHAVVTMESQGNPNALSNKGAIGVMQLMPATAQWLGVKDPWDPVQNINAGVKYLKQLSDRYRGNPQLTLAAYNAGPGTVDRAGGIPNIPETHNYVARGTSLLRSRLLDRPAPAPEAPAPPQQAGIKFEPDVEPPAQAPATASGIKFEPDVEPPASEPTPLQKAGTAFSEGLGLPTLATIGKGALGLVTGDQAAIQQGYEAAKRLSQGFVQGMAAEPGRIAGEMERTGEAIRQGNLPAIAYHTAGAIPIFGSQTQQIADDLARGDPAAAVGHTGALFAPFVAGPALGAVGRGLEAVGTDAQTAGTFMRGATGPALKATYQRSIPSLAAGSFGTMIGGPKLGALFYAGTKIPQVIGAGVAGGRAALEEAAAAAAEKAAQEAAARQAAQAAADVAMRAHVGAYETFERITQPGPPALPPASQFQQPPAGTYAEEQRFAALQPEVSTPTAAGPAPAEPPAAPPEAAKTPGQVYAESQGYDWADVPEKDRQVLEQIAQAHANVAAQQPPPQAAPPVTPPSVTPAPAAPEPPSAPPPETPQPPQTPQQIAEALKAEMEQSGTVAPPGPQPSFAEAARGKKVDALFDVMTRNRIPLSMVEQFGPKEWDMLAKYADVNPPSETTIGQLKQRLADYEKARNIPVTPASTPAEVQTAFEQARAARGGPAATIESNAQGSSATGPVAGKPAGSPGAPVPGSREPGTPVARGDATTIRVPGETTAYQGQYAVRELDDVYASHSGKTFGKNPDYQFRNDRDYSNPANQERIVVNSKAFDPAYPLADSPDATHGPPVIDPDGNVLGGNSRVMILDRVYTDNPAGAATYRAQLARKAPQFGIDPAQIAGMKRPVLVREISESELNPQRAITDFNKSGTASLTAAERATADARMMTPAAADYLASAIEGEGPDASLNDLLSGKRGAAIVNKLVDDGVFTMQEKPNLVDARTGSVTAAGKERISKMLLGQVFESADQLMRTPPELRAKLERVVAPVLRSGQKTGFNLLPTLRESIDLMEYARAHGISNLRDAIAQESMFGDAPKISPAAVDLAEFLRDNKPTEVSKAFRRYVANAEPTMFGESTPAQAFADAFGSEPPAATLGEMMQPKSAQKKPAARAPRKR